MWCDPDLAIAIAIANQDHGLDGYVGEALILILILAIASFHDHMPQEHELIGLAHDHKLMGLAHEHIMLVDLAMSKIRIRIKASPM